MGTNTKSILPPSPGTVCDRTEMFCAHESTGYTQLSRICVIQLTTSGFVTRIWTEMCMGKYSDEILEYDGDCEIRLPAFSGGSGSVLLVHWEFLREPPAQPLPLVLVPGNKPSSPDAQGQSRVPSSPVACLRVASSKCVRKEYSNREIQSNLFSFLSSQLPVFRQVFPTPSEMPFYTFLLQKIIIGITIFNWSVQCHTRDQQTFWNNIYSVQIGFIKFPILSSASLFRSCESVVVQRSTSSTTQFRWKLPKDGEKKIAGTVRSFLPGSTAASKSDSLAEADFSSHPPNSLCPAQTPSAHPLLPAGGLCLNC